MTPAGSVPRELSLLLVEDNQGDVDLVREHLEESGASASIEACGTLAGGLEELEKRSFDLLLLDLNLPDSRGLETLTTVLEAKPDIPVVVLTGLADDEIGAAAIRRGAQDFLPKDEISGPVLVRTLRHAIERHRKERELREAEHRARSYLEIAEAMIVALDRDGRITMINPTGADLLGYQSPSELEGQDWFDVAIRAGDRDRWHRLYREYLDGEGALENLHDPIVTRSGEERTFAWKSAFVRDGDGEVVGTLCCGLDVTEREKARQRLQLLYEALQAAYNAIVITDRSGLIEWANPAFTRMTGYSFDRTVGRTYGELVGSGVHDSEFFQDLWSTIVKGDVWQGRIVNRRKDGTLYPEEQTITPVRDESGQIAHFVAVGEDVSERVAAEEELRRTNRALRVISAANQALVWSSSEDEILDKMCRVAVEVGEYRFAWIGYLNGDDPDRMRPVAHRGDGGGYLDRVDLALSEPEASDGPVAAAVQTETPVVVRHIDPEKDSSSWEREALGSGFRSKVAIPLVADGRCLGALSIYSHEPDAFDEREIEILSEVGGDLAHGITMHRTRRRKAELEDQLHQAEKLRAVGQLAGGVAHDFNNYLTVITTLTEMVLEEPELDEGIREDVLDIQEAATSSARLTRQLLAFSRHQVAAFEVLDLGAAMRKMGSMLPRLLEESIRVELTIDDEPLPVRADPGQLEQVMMNLAVNARDAMPEGGTLTIEAGTVELTEDEVTGPEGLEPGTYVVLSVSDTGSGISKEEMPRIFEPFFTAKEAGTGLGLSTVYGIVKQAGGGIRVESELGEGARFEIYLPRQEAGELTELVEAASDSDSVEGTETILLVEDQVAVRRAVRRLLERSGYNVMECGSVSEAVSIHADSGLSIDLLVTDLGLPDGDGRTVAEAFLAQRPDLPVIYTSGYTPHELDFALELGPNEYFIEKPFDRTELTQHVQSALAAANSARR